MSHVSSKLAFAIVLVALVGGEASAKEAPLYIVHDYPSTLDRITQEITFRLDKAPQLLIWCFDESESMKDDQLEIQRQLVRVYEELKGVKGFTDDSVQTLVTSYGSGFHVGTRMPTTDLQKVRDAIKAIPIDNLGKEMMCSAVGQATLLGRKMLDGEKRQMMMIVVTDESGESTDNQAHLERAITTAKANHCPVYFLGREATFGYPYTLLQWRHPQTRKAHWLSMDAGPETAFPQILQTDGFGPRRDSFGSGFGSFDQMRMVRETGGVFFMLPSPFRLPGGQKPYDIEVLRHYRPDYRPRQELIADRDGNPLQSQLCKIIANLNPYNPQATKAVTLKTDFSPIFELFEAEVASQDKKTAAYLKRLAAAEKSLFDLKDARSKEEAARWQANYDLTRAQLFTFQARVIAYRYCLERFLADPESAPPTKEPKLELSSWRISLVAAKRVPGNERMVERASILLRKVIENHPGTPWARMAAWDLKRGFGVTLRPHYQQPFRRTPAQFPLPRL